MEAAVEVVLPGAPALASRQPGREPGLDQQDVQARTPSSSRASLGVGHLQTAMELTPDASRPDSDYLS